jgi:hypothetical protein
MDNHRVLTEAESKIFESGYKIGARFESRRCKELEREVERIAGEVARMRAALIRLRDCDWVISLPDRMDAVRDIAKNALDGKNV